MTDLHKPDRLFNDATRPYNTAGGYFRALVHKRSIFEGGQGAQELVLRYTPIDSNDTTVEGGTFGRLTSQVNWYFSQKCLLRVQVWMRPFESIDLTGNTQFLEKIKA